MRKSYMNPEAEVIEFDTLDVITTSGEEEPKDDFKGESANDDTDWTGWY